MTAGLLVEHLGAAFERPLGLEERVVALGVGDEAREQRGVPDAELVEGLADDAQSRGLDPVRPLPEVHRVQVFLQDLLLRVLLVEPVGKHHLAHLAVEVARRVQHPVLDQLLADRRPALFDLAGGGVLDERAHGSAEVDTRVLPERLVLGRDHRVDHELGHLFELDRLAILEPEHADLVAGGVVHDRPFGQLSQRPPDVEGRVAVAGREHVGARNDRGQAGADAEATEQEDDRKRARHIGRERETMPADRCARRDPRDRGGSFGSVPRPVEGEHQRVGEHPGEKASPRSQRGNQAGTLAPASAAGP